MSYLDLREREIIVFCPFKQWLTMIVWDKFLEPKNLYHLLLAASGIIRGSIKSLKSSWLPFIPDRITQDPTRRDQTRSDQQVTACGWLGVLQSLVYPFPLLILMAWCKRSTYTFFDPSLWPRQKKNNSDLKWQPHIHVWETKYEVKLKLILVEFPQL